MPIDLEAEYDNRARVPEHPEIVAGWARDAAAFRVARPDAELGVPYGARPRQTYDLFPADGAARGLVLFLHGGYWQRFDPSWFSHLARGPNAHGVAVALAGYDLCPDVTVAAIVDAARAAAVALHRRFGRRVTAAGHSAGGHLAACLVATDFRAVDPALPEDLVPAGLALSGLFELEPLVPTTVNAALGLDAAEAKRLSPLIWPVAPGRRFDAWVGARESGEYRRQSAALAAVWGGRGVATGEVVVADADHFTVIAPLADPASALTLRLVDLAAAVR